MANRIESTRSIGSDRIDRIDRINWIDLTAEMDLWTNFKLFRPKLSLNRTKNGSNTLQNTLKQDRIHT